MRITKVRLTRSQVVVDYTHENDTHNVTSSDAPLPSFVRAVEALMPLVLSILHLPQSYAGTIKGSDGKERPSMVATGLTMAEKQETELVTITAKKELPDAHSPFNIATPLRFIAHPEEAGSYSPALSDEHVAVVQEVLKEAKKYVKGERAQGQLPLDGDSKTEEAEEQEPAGGEVLDFGKGANGKPAGAVTPPKRKAK
jgi:hypothetical protein